ncbi:uncharacterized protein TM35_000102630 [Trypanosoma theileri]|uniref:Uncharacterized protein n=1 Tax=Trypanosoma theileri TaxID=67003 RepID=A0A1X0NZ91_9TRYP|nr:uncharacterized protein TM35_000102630 [Trypanosoma theileri]ORC89995.1 hypothetical protein TM35_000102630 [Trypanosoma theileri]
MLRDFLNLREKDKMRRRKKDETRQPVYVRKALGSLSGFALFFFSSLTRRMEMREHNAQPPTTQGGRPTCQRLVRNKMGGGDPGGVSPLMGLGIVGNSMFSTLLHATRGTGKRHLCGVPLPPTFVARWPCKRAFYSATCGSIVKRPTITFFSLRQIPLW